MSACHLKHENIPWSLTLAETLGEILDVLSKRPPNFPGRIKKRLIKLALYCE